MSDPIVYTKNGTLKGSIEKDINDKEYFSFKGIPYAKPPIGNLRFKAPQPVESWTGIRDAVEDAEACYSKHPALKTMIGSEDCLHLNVYTSSLSKLGNAPKPVMFWIHGGGFTSGSNSTQIYGPDFLISEDIVLVTINYRLHVLGFLSFDDPSLEISGNAGFKDIVMALKWVQDNIATFGGDPNNVTIFGESAGGAAVHYLILSPLAKGLFHKAILQSGCALNIWAQSADCAKQFAQVLDVKPYNEKALYDKLNSLSIEEIFKAGEKIRDAFIAKWIRPFGPVVEKPSPTAFISQQPADIIKSGQYNHVPILIGYTTAEGILSEILQKPKPFEPITDFELSIPYTLELEYGSDASKAVARKIKQFYFGDEVPSEKNKQAFYKLESDNFFIRELLKTVDLHVKTSSQPIYLYRMSIESELNMFKIMNNITEPGVCHADDIGYLFKTLITPKIEPGSIEDIGRRRFCRIWSNFAKYGNPNPQNIDELINVKWQPVKSKEIHFVDIGKELVAGVNPDQERVNFWNSILEVYLKNKLVTPKPNVTSKEV